MVNSIKFLDKINLQKYIYLIDSFISDKRTASMFADYFIQIRRSDTYWLTSSFDSEVNHLLDSIFLDVDEYNPPDFYDPTDKFNINENELKTRLMDKLVSLNVLINYSD